MAFYLSVIPFTAPVVAMARLPFLYGTDQMWEIYLSMGIMVLSVLLTLFMSAKIYRTAILMYGKRASIRDLYKWVFKA